MTFDYLYIMFNSFDSTNRHYPFCIVSKRGLFLPIYNHIISSLLQLRRLGWSSLAILLFLLFFDIHIWITYFLGFLLGIGLTLPNITLSTVEVLIIPDEYRGRITTLMQAIAVILIPISNIIGGLIS